MATIHFQLTLEEAKRTAMHKWIDPSDFRAHPWMLCRTGDAFATGSRKKSRVTCPACIARLAEDGDTTLACKWLKSANAFPFGSEQRTSGYNTHLCCPPQHDDDNAQCPHNTAPGNTCTCEVEGGNQGWELLWSRPYRRFRAGKNPDGSSYPGGKRWHDDDDNYDILQADGDDEFVVVCTDGTQIGTTKTLQEAKAVAQREYAGIQIAFHGSKEEFDATHPKE